MKIENIGRVHELLESRKHILDVIEKLETETITLTGEDGKNIDELDENLTDMVLKYYRQALVFTEKELEEL